MRGDKSNDDVKKVQPSPISKYLSSSEIETLLQLLVELRDHTLSRSSFNRATALIVELGGVERVADDCG